MNELTRSAFLPQLLAPFYPHVEDLGEFHRILPAELPDDYRRLLEHDGHMTITLEEYHGCRVHLEVLRSDLVDQAYVRKIVLRRANDQRVVLFGVVRLNLDLLPPQAVVEIQDESKPLGYVLIEHDILREVERLASWRIRTRTELRDLFGHAQSETLYGRTAIIHCNGVPAIELLEIVIA